MSDHTPRRPEWICNACAAPWPCASARTSIAGAFSEDGTLTARHMATLMELAAADLGVANPAGLYKRFVGWTLGKVQACRVCGKAGHDAVPGVPPRLVPCDGRAIPPIREPKEP